MAFWIHGVVAGNILLILLIYWLSCFITFLMSNSDMQIVSIAVFCRIYLKVLFLLSPKKVKHLIILNLLLLLDFCMDSMPKQLFAHSFSASNESIFLSEIIIIFILIDWNYCFLYLPCYMLHLF